MFHHNRKKMILMTMMVGIMAVTVQSFTTQPKKLKNIKAFPATMSYEEVDEAMDQFKADLGVKCGYCHTPGKDKADDGNPKKEITRNMIRMTEELNKKYIATIPHADSVKVQMVNCNTCHRGAPKPFGTPPPAGPGPAGAKGWGAAPPPPPHQ